VCRRGREIREGRSRRRSGVSERRKRESDVWDRREWRRRRKRRKRRKERNNPSRSISFLQALTLYSLFSFLLPFLPFLPLLPLHFFLVPLLLPACTRASGSAAAVDPRWVLDRDAPRAAQSGDDRTERVPAVRRRQAFAVRAQVDHELPALRLRGRLPRRDEHVDLVRRRRRVQPVLVQARQPLRHVARARPGQGSAQERGGRQYEEERSGNRKSIELFLWPEWYLLLMNDLVFFQSSGRRDQRGDARPLLPTTPSIPTRSNSASSAWGAAEAKAQEGVRPRRAGVCRRRI